MYWSFPSRFDRGYVIELEHFFDVVQVILFSTLTKSEFGWVLYEPTLTVKLPSY